MKKVFVFVVAMMLAFSTAVYAGGDQNHGDVGQGPTGGDGQGNVSQNHGG